MPKDNKVLKDARNYALSDEDIRKLLGPDIAIHTYDQLKNMKSVDELFDSKGRGILLYQNQSPTAGHWNALLRKKKGIEVFDSYGEKPDKQLDEIDEDLKEQTNQDAPYLTRLLKGSGLPIYYNPHQYQHDGSDINSCGRWAVARCIYGNKSNEEFKKIVDTANKRGMSNDDFVCALTMNWLGK